MVHLLPVFTTLRAESYQIAVALCRHRRDGGLMDSTANRSVAALTDDELDRLVEIVIEDFGFNLPHDQFTDVAMTLFDDMPGLEVITTKKASRYVAALWQRYRSKPC
jgi:hypothetical protein